MQDDSCGKTSEQLRELNQEKFRRNPNAYGWTVKGWTYFTPASGSGRSYRVEYEATIAPLELTMEKKIESLSVDVPDELVEELLIPVREEVRKVVYGSLERAGLKIESI